MEQRMLRSLLHVLRHYGTRGGVVHKCTWGSFLIRPVGRQAALSSQGRRARGGGGQTRHVDGAS